MKQNQLLAEIETYIGDYCALPDPMLATVLALWAVGTHLYQSFDAFPYLTITAATKRAGKTRLAEVLSLIAHNGKQFAAMTPAVLFALFDDPNGITLFCDEAEELSSESATVMRSVLNVGYRKGQTIPRRAVDGVREYNVYGPKVFILIGDVFDTLRDRSIVIELVRGVPRMLFKWSEAQERGTALRGGVARVKNQIADAVANYDPKPLYDMFESSRDAEIWTPVFALSSVLCPDRVSALRRFAVDMCSTKTADKRRYTDMAKQEAARNEYDYGVRALRDLSTVIGTHEIGRAHV